MKLTGPITHQWIKLITETETVLSRTSPTRKETSSESYMTPSGKTLPGARRPIPLLSMKAKTKEKDPKDIWNWIGHTLRKPTSDTTRQALEWNPQGKRKVGRPVKTWRRSVEEELKQANITWNTAKRTAANRVRWRSTVSALCSTRNPMV